MIRNIVINLCSSRAEVPGRHSLHAVADRELLSLDYPRAVTARGVVGRRRARETPPSCHSEKRAMFTQMRAETHCITSVCVPFRTRYAYVTRADLLV